MGTQIKAGGAYFELHGKNNAFSKMLKGSEKLLTEFGQRAQATGAKLAAIGTAAAAPMLAAAKGFATAGETIDDFARRSRLSAETISELSYASEITGKSIEELIPLMRMGFGPLAELRRRARELGLTMSGEDAAAANTLAATWAELWAVARKLGNNIGAAVTPTLIKWSEWATHVISTSAKWIDANRQTVTSVFRVAVGVAAAGASLIAIGKTVAIAGAALGMLAPLAAALLSPIGLVTAGVAGLGAALLTHTDAGNEALAGMGAAFGELKSDAVTAWDAISARLAAGDLAAAAELALLAVKLEWEKLTAKLLTVWTDFKSTAAGTWIELSATIETAMAETGAFIQSAWAKTVGGFKSLWGEAVNWVSKKAIDFLAQFDKTLDADDAKKTLDDQWQAKAAEIEKGKQSDLADIEKRRQGRRADIDKNRDGAHDNNFDQTQAQQAAAQKRLDDARKAFSDTMTAAKATTTGKKPATKRPGLRDLKNATRTAVEQRASVLGTFSAAHAGRIGGDPNTPLLAQIANYTKRQYLRGTASFG